jgi:hypothetical protein
MMLLAVVDLVFTSEILAQMNKRFWEKLIGYFPLM